MNTVLSQDVYESQQILLIQMSFLLYIMMALDNNFKIVTMEKVVHGFRIKLLSRVCQLLYPTLDSTFYIFYPQLSPFFSRCFQESLLIV